MKYGKACKDYMVDKLTQSLKGNKDLFVTDYIGLTSVDLQELRKKLKGFKASYTVIKNSIGRIALKDCGFDPIVPLIEGSVGLVLSKDDPVLTSKVLMDFSKKNDRLKIKGGLVDGELFDEASVKELAHLPSRNVLLSIMLGTMKSPITGFVNVLAGTLRSFVYVIDAIKKKAEEQKKTEDKEQKPEEQKKTEDKEQKPEEQRRQIATKEEGRRRRDDKKLSIVYCLSSIVFRNICGLNK